MLKTSVRRNGLPYGSPPNSTIRDLPFATHPDFRVDRLAIINYSDAVQFGPTQYWGSILAHGTVDNIVVSVPNAPVGNFTGTKSNSTFRAGFTSRTNWFYSLERTLDFVMWSDASALNRGTGGMLVLSDTNATGPGACYRVKALKP